MRTSAATRLRSLVGLWALTLGACQSDATFIYVESGPFDGASAMLEAIELTEGGRTTLESATWIDLEVDQPEFGPTIIVRKEHDDVSARVIRLGFDRSLAALELVAGPLQRAPDDAFVDRELPSWFVAEERIVRADSGDSGQWGPLTTTSTPLFELRLPVRCAALGERLVNLNTRDESGFIVPWEGGKFLLATRPHFEPQRYFEISPDGTAMEVSSPAPLLEVARSAFASSDGSVFFAGSNGEVWRNGQRVVQFEHGQRIRFLAATVGGAGELVDLVAVGRGGVVSRFAQGEAQDIFDFGIELVPPEQQFLSGGIAVVEPGHYVIVREDSPAILRVVDGAPSTELIESQLGFSGIMHNPRVGTVATSAQGVFFLKRVEAEWESLGAHPESETLSEVVIAFEDGFMFGGSSGFVGQYRGPYGFCPVQPFGGNTLHDAALVGNVLVFSGSNPSGRLPVTVIQADP